MTNRHEITRADILPWAECAKDRAEHRKRITAIKRAYRVLYMSGLNLAEARARLGEMASDNADVALMLTAIESGQRALAR